MTIAKFTLIAINSKRDYFPEFRRLGMCIIYKRREVISIMIIGNNLNELNSNPGQNPSILPHLCYEWIVYQAWIFSFHRATGFEERKLWIQTTSPPLKIDFEQHPICSGGDG